MTKSQSTPRPHEAAGRAQSSEGEEVFAPQRNSRWIDLLVFAVVLFIVLGGIGKALSDSDILPAEPEVSLAPGAEACPEGGCVRPPDEDLCSDHAIKAVAMRDGQRLYFTGDHPGYPGIIAMHIERGDRWFCTTAAAEQNGFVAAP